MTKQIRRLLSVLLTLTVLLSAMVPAVSAAEDLGQLASKEADLVSGDDAETRYQITLSVPGADAISLHDEIIVMVDGSYSMDDEWESMKETLIEIGKTVLDGEGNTQLTLMSFGISPNVVLEHVTSVEELEATLPETPGGLLLGRSATNCDGAFEGIQAYIDAHDETLNETHVIFLSDGGVNMNSTPVDWIACAEGISASYALNVQLAELAQVALGNADVSVASRNVYGDALDGMIANMQTLLADEETLVALDEQIAAKEAEIAELTAAGEDITAAQAELDALNAEHASVLEEYNTVSAAVNDLVGATDDSGKTAAQRWVVEVYKSFYAYAGLTEGEAYPVYTAETAYMNYQNEYNVYYYNTFYYVLSSAGITSDLKDGVRGGYAAESAAELAAMTEVNELYLVRYGTDSRSGWMTGVEGTTFVQSDSIATLTTALADVLTTLSITPYSDVVITDYMSKWVDLDTESLVLYSGSTAIWNAVDGWLIEDGRPVEGDPVAVELVEADGYADGGENVVGNTNGDIYKLTWNVKDGALLRSDNYKLTYEVVVDTEEKGFTYGQEVPSNGNTDIHYTDAEGNEVTEDIVVPNVVVEKSGDTGCGSKPDCDDDDDKDNGCGGKDWNDRPDWDDDWHDDSDWDDDWKDDWRGDCDWDKDWDDDCDRDKDRGQSGCKDNDRDNDRDHDWKWDWGCGNDWNRNQGGKGNCGSNSGNRNNNSGCGR